MRPVIRLGLALGGSLLVAAWATTLTAGADPSPPLPREKQALEDFAAAHRDTGPTVDKARDAGRPLEIQADGPPDTGMLGPVGAPISSAVFTATNAWASWTSATTYVQVYAGDSGESQGSGMILVVRRTGSAGLIDHAVAPTTSLVRPPVLGGPLRITRVEGSEVIVVNPTGRELRFNPGTGLFD